MVKKRRLGNNTLSPSSSRMKLESNNSSGMDDVMLARDRLKGALEDLMVQSDDDSDSSQEETPLPPPPPPPPPPPLVNLLLPPPFFKKTRVVQRRRKRKDPDLDMAFHHTYVMKLYDRSVDLAQFSEDTPLYPICRAWMANKPRTPYNSVKCRSPTPEPKTESEDTQDPAITKLTFSDSDSDCEFIKDVYKLPPPSITGIRLRIPIPEPVSLKGFNFSETEAPPMKENLLRDHLERWGQIRRNWLNSACENEARYAESGQILTAIYKRAQKAFQ